MHKDIKQLSKKLVKLDREYETINQKHTKKLKRKLRQGMKVSAKLTVAVQKLMPLSNDTTIGTMVQNQMNWMQERMTARRGRRIQRI
jgi:hypothetical protein